MGVSWYNSLAAGWLPDMRSKQVPISTTSARRHAAESKLPFFLFLFASFIYCLYFFICALLYLHCCSYIIYKIINIYNITNIDNINTVLDF